MARKLTRKEMREQLYRMLFQLEFHKDAELDEQLALFMDDLQEIREGRSYRISRINFMEWLLM